MAFLPVDILRKRKLGQVHTSEEIVFLVKSYISGELPDYQMAAWLMAANFNPLSTDETFYLTREMRDSGDFLEFPENIKAIDKHSTGGVGDKASLVLGPIAAAAGVTVPMITGRGLGHTGGTTDKLESIPGYNAEPDLARFKEILTELNLCIIGQTPNICPADKKIYGLRDVTATVENIPLICASILSKKLAEGISGLVMDVKFGSGAFMKTYDDAENLAKQLILLGDRAGLEVRALLTSMEQPLGRKIGNALEIEETLEILSLDDTHNEYDDTVELSLKLASRMIYMAGKAQDLESSEALAREVWQNKSALQVFEKMVKALGGDLTQLPKAKHIYELRAEEDGHLLSMDVAEVGMSALVMGAGRRATGDEIDPVAGLYLHKKTGEAIKKGEQLATFYASGEEQISEGVERYKKAITIGDDSVPPPVLIKDELTKDDV